jgi:hypothetical protein
VRTRFAGGQLAEQREYFYANAHWGRRGRGWLGFGEITATLLRGEGGELHFVEQTRTTYDNTTVFSQPGMPPDSTRAENGAVWFYPFAFLPAHIERVSATATDGLDPGSLASVSQVTREEQTWVTKFSFASRPFPVLDTRLVETFTTIAGIEEPTPLATREESFSYDEFGNVTSRLIKPLFRATPGANRRLADRPAR